MATKTTKKSTKSTAKPKTTKKVTSKDTKKKSSIYATNVSIVFGMAVEALILFLGYLIIMSVA